MTERTQTAGREAVTDPWLDARIDAYRTRYAGVKIQPLRKAVPLRIPELAQIREAIPNLLTAQQTLLRHFLSERGPAGTLEFFGVPGDLSRWMSVLTDPGIDPPILRVDVLPLPDGRARICEINIDSCVGVAEAADLFRLEQLRHGEIPQQTPYEHLAVLVGQELARLGGDKVCLFDWTHYQASGWFTLDRLKDTIATALPGVEVFLANELGGVERVDARTVVFRIFPSADAYTDPALTAELFGRAGHVLTDFSSDLLSSKLWMAVYHDDRYRGLLTEEMRDAIDRTVPWTTRADASNLDSLLESKDRYFFKSATDFGGRGVMAGHSTPEDEIRKRILDDGSGGWVAQEKCETASLEVHPLDAPAPVTGTGVLGLYRFGRQWSGVMVRASADTDVVNVTRGSLLGWGYEV